MKLLFDQKISFRVVKLLRELFPEARHVNEYSLQKASDMQIWSYPKENQYHIVTFDADFNDLVTLYGHPPKVIWLRIGNTSSQNLVRVFSGHIDSITSFLTEYRYEELGCLVIER